MSENVFINRLAKPMLLSEGSPFDSADYVYKLKLDEIRFWLIWQPIRNYEIKEIKTSQILIRNYIIFTNKLNKDAYWTGSWLLSQTIAPIFFCFKEEA